MNDIAVSVVCNAYNHGKYIADALEGFVMQKTSFPFEVLVHDDASTDNTAEIIREYERKYPEIIKPIYEKENQYCKHYDEFVRIQYGRVKGKYTALCEGDDYWTDPYKLQKQYDALEAHPEINICATAAKTEFNGTINGRVSPKDENSVIQPEEVIKGDGGFVATASLMYRSSIRTNSFDFFKIEPMDYSLQIMGSLYNGMLFLKDETAVYRKCTAGSWTVRMKKDNVAFVNHNKKMLDMLECLDKETGYAFHDAVSDRETEYEFWICFFEEKYRKVIEKKYRKHFKTLTGEERLKFIIGSISPKGLKVLGNCRRKYRKTLKSSVEVPQAE